MNVSSMPSDQRILLAKERTTKVVHYLRAIIEMHEANAIVVYSPTLAQQIPKSYAAHAFNQFQRSMHFFEIVRLCALWDGADRDKENVPTITALIDHPDVIKALAAETRARWAGRMPPRNLSSSADLEVEHAIEECIQRRMQKRADREALTTNCLLKDAIQKARYVEASPKLRSVLNMRHRHLAHSLTRTRLEQKGPVDSMKYGDEVWLFDETITIVDLLHIGVNGAAFSWDDARQIACRNAEALWKSCTFAVVD